MHCQLSRSRKARRRPSRAGRRRDRLRATKVDRKAGAALGKQIGFRRRPALLVHLRSRQSIFNPYTGVIAISARGFSTISRRALRDGYRRAILIRRRYRAANLLARKPTSSMDFRSMLAAERRQHRKVAEQISDALGIRSPESKGSFARRNAASHHGTERIRAAGYSPQSYLATGIGRYLDWSGSRQTCAITSAPPRMFFAAKDRLSRKVER